MAIFAFRQTSGEERVLAVFWHTRNELAETIRIVQILKSSRYRYCWQI